MPKASLSPFSIPRAPFNYNPKARVLLLEYCAFCLWIRQSSPSAVEQLWQAQSALWGSKTPSPLALSPKAQLSIAH
jgi:hypothetical protein